MLLLYQWLPNIVYFLLTSFSSSSLARSLGIVQTLLLPVLAACCYHAESSRGLRG